MPPRKKAIPSYRLHKQSGQAIVTLTDGLGGRRDVLLGEHDTPESRAEYLRVVSEWETCGRRLSRPTEDSPGGLTVNELILAYWTWAVSYHGWGKRDGLCLKGALSVLKELYGHTPAGRFGPLALKASRNRMISLGWSRNYINAQVNRLRRMFRWAAAEEMLPGRVHEDLKQVEGLHRGKTTARESKKVKPVSPEQVEATRPHLPAMVKAMVDFQLLAGCRPSEVCMLRPMDLDMRNPACWIYRPQKHKSEHLDLDRLILIGPKAQEVLRPYLGTRLEAYCFSPAQSEAVRHATRRQNRKSPLTPSQKKRQPKKDPRRPKRELYDKTSYRNAIYRACDKAFPPPAPLARRSDAMGARRRPRPWRRTGPPGSVSHLG